MPGVPQRDSSHQFAEHGLSNTYQLEQLLTWHDGLDTESNALIGQICIMPGFYLLGLQEILQAHQDFRDDDRWDPHWIPFMTDGGGDYMFIDTARPEVPCVHHYRSAEFEHPAEYTSIACMLRTISKAYATGVFFIDGERIRGQRDQYALIAAEINPDIEWWLT